MIKQPGGEEFEPEPVKTPTSIPLITVTLYDNTEPIDWTGEGDPIYQAIHYDFRIECNDGSIYKRRGDLAPYLTKRQQKALLRVLSEVRVQADKQIIATAMGILGMGAAKGERNND